MYEETKSNDILELIMQYGSEEIEKDKSNSTFCYSLNQVICI